MKAHKIRDPRSLVLFAKVVEFGGISGAARALSMQKGTVSRALTKLEAAVGGRLLIRAPKKPRVTELGQTLLLHCRRLAHDIEEAEAAVGNLQGTATGRLKIACPVTFGRSLLSPLLPGFMEKYPRLRMDVELTNRPVDPAEEGFDLVIRLGPQRDASLVAVELGLVHYVVCASPQYLRQHGTPKKPHDLARHYIIDTFDGAERSPWTFSRGQQTSTVEVAPRADFNDPILRRDAVAAGLGIGLLPLLVIKKHIKDRRLAVLLPGWRSTKDFHIHAVYPASRQLTPRGRALLAYLGKQIPCELMQSGRP